MEAFVQKAFVVFNICEGILWCAVAVGFAWVFGRRRTNGDLMLAGGLLFLAFGISDFAEIGTGGWYKPWWMLLWKASTLAGFVLVHILFRRRRVQAVD